MALTLTQINQLYVSYFGRPADANGASYYQSVNATPADVAAAFSASTESQALFGNQTTAQQINSIYQNLFGRDAELAGLSYWNGEIAKGAVTLAGAARAIGDAAQNTDRTTLINKVLVANSFTQALDTPNEILGYSGTAAANTARTFLSSVTATNLTASQAAVDTQVANTVAAGSTIALTTGTDALVGTGRDEFFTATGTTSQSADTINGGAGIDTLVYTGAATGYTLPTLTNVERLQFNAPTATAIDTSAVTGLTNVIVNSPVITGTTITTANGVTTSIGRVASAATQLAVTDIAVANTGATVNVGLNNGLAVATLTVTDTNLTTLNLASDGAANSIATLTTAGVAAGSTLNVFGSSKLTIGTLNSNFTTVNASATTNGVDITFSGGDVIAVGGAGNDRFAFGSSFTSADAINGAGGNDTLALNGLNYTDSANATQLAAINGVVGVETIEFTGSTGVQITGGAASTTGTANSNFFNSAITKLVFNGAGNDVVNNAGSARTYAFGADNGGDATFNLGSNVSTVNIALEGGSAATTGSATVGTLAFTPLNADIAANPALVTNVNIVSSTTTTTAAALTAAGANTISALTAQAGSNIKVSGAADLTITALTNRANVDASTFTGKLVVTGTAGVDTFILGSGADTVNNTNSTFANMDTITGLSRADTLVTGLTLSAAGSLITYNAASATTLQAALTGAEAAIVSGASAGAVAAQFTYGGDTYVVGNNDTTNAVTSSVSTDVVIKVTGTQVLVNDASGIHGAV